MPDGNRAIINMREAPPTKRRERQVARRRGEYPSAVYSKDIRVTNICCTCSRVYGSSGNGVRDVEKISGWVHSLAYTPYVFSHGAQESYTTAVGFTLFQPLNCMQTRLLCAPVHRKGGKVSPVHADTDATTQHTKTVKCKIPPNIIGG